MLHNPQYQTILHVIVEGESVQAAWKHFASSLGVVASPGGIRQIVDYQIKNKIHKLLPQIM
uniref:Putative ovule protein n=1 Tax=Solanum chacoense TaxID=4108 RepID=A0A0V0GLG4_SOLCH